MIGFVPTRKIEQSKCIRTNSNKLGFRLGIKRHFCFRTKLFEVNMMGNEFSVGIFAYEEY
ncbi:hypothetical protein HanIR_Chr05g0217851 [Helianthus annuus]|nr:hypothetical protein HanIR_Chr05g0217851 [Helianthus annuus]